MAVTLNEITKYVKHNNSDIKFDINVIPAFEQPAKIPQKVVNPERLLEDEHEKTLDTNVLKYRRDEIINLPSFLDKFFDLNNYYTFGVVQEKSFIYSLLYVVDTNFKFLSETDQAAVVADKSMEFLEALGNNTEFKKGKTEATKALHSGDFTNNRVVEFLSGHLEKNIIILDLNEKTHQLHREFNGDFTPVVVLKSGTTYFPLSCIDGTDISNSTAISLMKFFK
jgi:hypothetical protein